MKKNRVKTLFSILAFMCVLVMPAPSFALKVCGCKDTGSAVEAASGAEQVFLGTATRIKSRGSDYEIYFTVDKIWKGPQDKFLKVETDRGDAYGTITYGVSCDAYGFEEGARYLVFTYREGRETRRVSRCGRTQKATEASADIVALGAPLYDFTVKPDTAPPNTLENHFFGEQIKDDAKDDPLKLEH